MIVQLLKFGGRYGRKSLLRLRCHPRGDRKSGEKESSADGRICKHGESLQNVRRPFKNEASACAVNA